MGSRLSRQPALSGEATLASRRRRGQRRVSAGDTGCRDFSLSSLVRRTEKLRRSASPYVRRVAWVRDIQKLLHQGRAEAAANTLRLLRKDMGMEGTSLSDMLYKNSAFLNLVDPISHELLLSLARDMQCPKKDTNPVKSADKICRQLIYHLTPHSKWVRQGGPRKKSQVCLKSTLQKKLLNDTVDLSGIPLSNQDLHRVAYYLQSSGEAVAAVDLSFTDMRDDGLRQLLPFLGALPKLSALALNGNRLTTSILKDLTEATKDSHCFPSLAWVDLGNNVDIFTMPQPLLVALRRRFGLKSSLPTIYEYSEGQTYDYQLESSGEDISMDEVEEELEPESWEKTSKNFTKNYCER